VHTPRLDHRVIRSTQYTLSKVHTTHTSILWYTPADNGGIRTQLQNYSIVYRALVHIIIHNGNNNNNSSVHTTAFRAQQYCRGGHTDGTRENIRIDPSAAAAEWRSIFVVNSVVSHHHRRLVSYSANVRA